MLITRPLTLPNGAVLKNRIAKSAMSERLGMSDTRAPTAALPRLYRQWAEGGAGLLVTGNVMVDPRRLGEPGNVAVEDERHLEALRAWATAATADGAAAWVQLNHPGRQSPRTLDPDPVAPSAVPMRGAFGAFATPRALSEAEIERIIERFATAASVVQRAGFTGVQIHGAHGYLVSQFLAPRTNLRDDAWGGSPERRMRFLLEVVRAVRASVGGAFSVGVKLNSADFQRGGFDAEASMAVVEALEAEGIDLLEISGGTYERSVMFAEELSVAATSTRSREAFFLDYARQVRDRTSLPLMLTGGFRSAAAMEEALASGAIDVVGMARPLAVQADLPARLMDGSAKAAASIRLRTGLSSLDALVAGAWYGAQIERMGEGLPPDASLGRWRALWWYLRDQWRGRTTSHLEPAPA